MKKDGSDKKRSQSRKINATDLWSLLKKKKLIKLRKPYLTDKGESKKGNSCGIWHRLYKANTRTYREDTLSNNNNNYKNRNTSDNKNYNDHIYI